MQGQTAHGYGLLAVLSALQKDIRRGHDANALYWALELLDGYDRHLWNRLVIIANEDVGIGAPLVLALIPQYRTTYFTQKAQGKRAASNTVANAVLTLAKSPKTRIADHLQCVVAAARGRKELPPLPPHGLPPALENTQNDLHPEAVGLALCHALTVGEEETAMHWALELAPLQDTLLWRKLARFAAVKVGSLDPTTMLVLPSLEKTYRQLRAAKKHGEACLPIANAILLLARSPRGLDDLTVLCQTEPRLTARKRPALPDYALDKHTPEGQALGRGVTHWLTEGCATAPPAQVPDPYRIPAARNWQAGYTIQPWPEQSGALEPDHLFTFRDET